MRCAVSSALSAVDPGDRCAPLQPERLREVVQDLYGLDGHLDPLAHERDCVYRLVASAETSYVIRVSPPSEPLASLRLQNDALLAIARNDPALPAPRVLPSTRGRDVEEIESVGDTVRLRVMTYLPGRPILSGPRSPAQLNLIGQTLARLHRALAAAGTGPVTFPLLWDIRASPQLKPFARFIADDQRRRLVDATLGTFEAEGVRALAGLPAQLIHNDFNPKNILFDGPGHAIVGIIDFGDVVHAPRVIDVGVTIARHAEHDNVLQDGAAIVAAYAAVMPLTAAEIACLFGVVTTRLAMRAVIGSCRVHHHDVRGDRAQIDQALALLERFTALGAANSTQCWMHSSNL